MSDHTQTSWLPNQAQPATTEENRFLNGVRNGVPIALGYLAVSFSFGMLCLQMGLPGWAAVLISLTNLTSAGQFAGAGVLVTGGGFLELALTQLVINLRYSLMSATLSQKIGQTVTSCHRLGVAFFITDEIFAVAASKKGLVGRRYLYGLGLISICGWVGGTLLGVIAGQLLPDVVVSALSVALYAMFVAIILPPAKRSFQVTLVVLCSAGLSCLLRFVPLFAGLSSGLVIVICALISAGLGAFFFPLNREVTP